MDCNKNDCNLGKELFYLRSLMADDYKGRLVLYGTLDIVYLIIVIVYIARERTVSALVCFFIFLFFLLTSACWTYYKKYRFLEDKNKDVAYL